MRGAFFRTLETLAGEDDRIELVVGDLGFGVVDAFREAFPDRFLNVGVAEQNMTGVATGLALTGSVVFTYSIANFPTLRCLEQVRNDACYHRANVKIVAVGGGLAYGALGISHHATEDLAILRAIPGIAVAAPGDPLETVAVTREIARMDGPAYLRLGRAGEPTVHVSPPRLPPGSSIELASGDEVVLISTGGMLQTALTVQDSLTRLGVSAGLISMPWVDPLDVAAVERASSGHTLVATIEEHSIRGGLGGAVAEVLSELSHPAPLLRLGLPPVFTSTVGSQAYLLEHYGLDAKQITKRIIDRLKGEDQ